MRQVAPAGLLLGSALLFLLVQPPAAHAFGLGDLKNKAKEKAKQEADKQTEKKTNDAPKPEEEAATSPAPGGGGKVSSVSTKFDFVPGDKVILMEDFTRDELGEFPSRWRLVYGNFDIVDYDGVRRLRLNGDDGIIAIKGTSLPAKWTLEFDIDQKKMAGPCVWVGGQVEGSRSLNWFASLSTEKVNFQPPNDVTSTSVMPGGLDGPHHVSLMVNGMGVKLYVDRERLVNFPEMVFKPGELVNVAFRLQRTVDQDPMIANVRFAEGGKSKVDLLGTPFVTHGINFDTGSDRIKPESAPVLRQIGTYLKENAAVKVLITGHTDDVGEAAANLELSKRRAQAVAASLASDFGIEASRMSAAGKGESAPMASNDSPEGKAMNRRVEFSKH